MTAGRPFISVVVPTHGRPQALRRCLEALARQCYPADAFEVIVIDDGSPQAADVERAVGIGGLAIRLVRQRNSGPAMARNHGAGLARGALLAFTDDDCEPEGNWLATLADVWRARPECLIGGRTANLLADDPYASANQLLISYLYDYFNRDPENAAFFASNNMAVSSAEFVRVGGFDARFALAAGEDRDLCDRWRHSGRSMVYAPGAVVAHAHALTFLPFWRQHVHYGRGAVMFRRFRSARTSDRIRIEPFRFYAGLARYPFSRTPLRRAMFLSMLMLTTQIAGAAGFFAELISHQWRDADT